MLTIQINNKQYNIATEWSEITVEQYTQLVLYAGEMSHVRLLSILTGLHYEVLNNLPCDAFLLQAVPQLKFMATEFNPFQVPRGKTITIGNNELKVIHDPSKERFGQKLFMQQLVTNAIASKANHATLVAPVVACYYAPLLHADKKWEEAHVENVQALVQKMPVVQAYPEADFFLRGYIRYAPTRQTF